jgi:hypothetical protein
MKLTPVAVAGLVVLGLVAVPLILQGDAVVDIDDAPITYRYAENVAAGRGFVYNPGESVWGTTTPLYTFLLVPAIAANLPVAMASWLLGLVSGVGIVLLAALIAAELTGSRLGGVLAGLWCALSAPVAAWSMSGMETPVYTALILGTWAVFARGGTSWAAGLAGLAYLTRADGLILLGPLLLSSFVRHRRLPVREVLTWLVVVLPWTVFALLQFDSFLPQSFAAKRAHARMAPATWFVRYFLAWPWWLALGGAAAALLPSRLLESRSRPAGEPPEGESQTDGRKRPAGQSTLVGLALWALLYTAAYTFSGLDYYEWYCAPLIPVLGILAVAGLARIAHVVGASRAARSWALAGLGALLLLTATVPRWALLDRHKSYLDSVEQTRIAVGRWLREHTPDDASVLVGAVGHIGYESRRRIVDQAGLVSPPGVSADYYVGHDGDPDPTSRFGTAPVFLRQHRLVKVFRPGPPFDNYLYKVFRRLDAPSPLPDELLFRNGIAPEQHALIQAHARTLDLTSWRSLPYLAEGWSLPEAGWGTWAADETVALHVILAPATSYRLRLRMRPHYRNGHDQAITVSYNGREIGGIVLYRHWQDPELIIPAVGMDGQPGRLEFRFAYAVSPAELGRDADTRRLAAVFREVSFEPVQSEPAQTGEPQPGSGQP